MKKRNSTKKMFSMWQDSDTKCWCIQLPMGVMAFMKKSFAEDIRREVRKMYYAAKA